MSRVIMYLTPSPIYVRVSFSHGFQAQILTSKQPKLFQKSWRKGLARRSAAARIGIIADARHPDYHAVEFDLSFQTTFGAASLLSVQV